MTGLLIGTFFIAGVHTILWLPKSLQWRKNLKKLHEEKTDSAINENTNDTEERKPE